MKIMLLSQADKVCQVPQHPKLNCPFVIHSVSMSYAAELPENKTTPCLFITKSKTHYPVDLTLISTEIGLVLVWYSNLHGSHPLIKELNSLIVPSYLSKSSYGWYFSSSFDDVVLWQKTVPTGKNDYIFSNNEEKICIKIV